MRDLISPQDLGFEYLFCYSGDSEDISESQLLHLKNRGLFIVRIKLQKMYGIT